jgi:hypothetical protein
MDNINDIKKELLTQDNRITHQPMFIVMEKKEYPTTSDYSYDLSYYVNTDGDNLGTTIKEAKDCLIEEECIDNPDKIYSMSDDELQEKYGVREVFIFEIDVFVQAFFTAKSAKNYIKSNNHNLRKPFFYTKGTYRNYEMQAIRNHLMKSNNIN